MAGQPQPPRTERGYSSRYAARLLGISYRQIDYWLRTIPMLHEGVVGTGNFREIPPHVVETLDLVARLVKSGIQLRVAEEVVQRAHGAAVVRLPMPAIDVELIVRRRTVEQIEAAFDGRVGL